MRDRLAAAQELPSPQDIDPCDAHLARAFVPSTAHRLTEQETIQQSINEQRSVMRIDHTPQLLYYKHNYFCHVWM